MTRSEFIDFLKEFRRDLDENRSNWKNKTLEDFLEAMQACTEDVQRLCDNLEMNVDANRPTWDSFKIILEGASVYDENKNQKKLWRERWLCCINELTSLELQRKSWVDKSNINPHWSFVEFMCSYFDDLGIDNCYEYQLNQGWITRTEFDAISVWHQLLDKYDSPKNDDYNVEAILSDEKWLMVVEEGKKSKYELSKYISSDEKQILFEDVGYKLHLQ